jgi:hypothetical protein
MSYNLVKRLINLISGGNSENKTNYSPYSFMAFGSGPRNCVGMRFAMEELKIAISALVIGSFVSFQLKKLRYRFQYLIHINYSLK